MQPNLKHKKFLGTLQLSVKLDSCRFRWWRTIWSTFQRRRRPRIDRGSLRDWTRSTRWIQPLSGALDVVAYGDSGGVANGSIVDEGPLMGLVSSVTRSLDLPFGEGNDTALFTESQVVQRILSPSIITAENNSAPVLVQLGFVEGLIVGEGGSTGTLVAHVTDAEFNIESVTVDLTPLGGSVTTLNDRGLDGDSSNW